MKKSTSHPLIAEVLEYRGLRMECSVESTPHEEARIYSSAYDGGELLTQFGKPTKNDETDEIPTRAQGEYANTSNPWPRVEEKELKAVAEMQERKPCSTRRQGNRWDQYGESSSASPSETHGMSDSSMITESTRGPCESASKSQRAAQPHRLQKANKGDGSAGDDSSWKQASEWEGSQWSAPTKWTLN